MFTAKHYVNKTYGSHMLSRIVTGYNVTTIDCGSTVNSGYKGTEVTLVDEPAWNEKFSSYSITGATLTGNNFVINNDVTAQANYETAKNVTLQTDGHGSIAANRNSGFIGDQVTLSNTANSGYAFTGYSITGATLTGNKFNFVGNNVTAKAWFSALPTTGTITVTSNAIGPSRQYLIPLAYNGGVNRSIVVSTTDTDFGWQGGNNSGSMNASYVATMNAGKCINSADHTIKVSAQITAGNLETWTAYMASNKSTKWRYRLAGMKLTTGQVFDYPPFIISYDYTGFGNSYDRTYGGSTAYHPSTYQSQWSYEQGKDGTVLTANIPAGYVPVIIASYVNGDDGTYNNGSAYINYTWKYTAEL